VNGGDVIDLHFERRASFARFERRIRGPATGVISQSEQRSAMNSAERLEQPVGERHAQDDPIRRGFDRLEPKQLRKR
jgi:hypothetical protein